MKNTIAIQTLSVVLGLSVFGCDAAVDDSAEAKEELLTGTSKAPPTCAPVCAGRECGPDPVHGISCGTCGTGQTCDNTSGRCVATCTPNCNGRTCGLDPVCGTSCGTCGSGQTCNNTTGQCTTTCTPNCNGRTCGTEPVCGTSCGSCGSGQTCDNTAGQCTTTCTPNCNGRACGTEPACGTSCGTCAAGLSCTPDGQCVDKHPPIAIAGPPQTVACNANTGMGTAQLNGSMSHDPDGGPITVIWKEGATQLASTSIATVSLGFGVHQITVLVTDSTGDSSSATTSVTVGKAAPIFQSKLAPIQIASCGSGTSVSVPIPTAIDHCALGPVKMTGTVISVNGTVASIPVIGGSVALPAGTATIRWTATADDLTTTADQLIQIGETPGVFASNTLTLADGAHIDLPGGGSGSMVNSGTQLTSLGVEARVGSIVSGAPVVLRDRAHVSASITTASTVTKSNGVFIGGKVTEHANPVYPSAPTLPGSIPTNSNDVILQPDQQKSVKAGTYRTVSIASRSTLRLSAGTYYLDSLDIEPQATLALDGSGAVTIYVRSQVIFRGAIVDPKGVTGNVFLGYLGSSAMYIEAPFFGILAAPKASVTLRSVSTPHVGSFFAKDLTLDAHATVVSRPAGCQ